MAYILHMARYSNPHFYTTFYAGIPLVTCYNSDRVVQLVFPHGGGVYKLFIKQLLVTTLAGNLSIQKLIHGTPPKGLVAQAVWDSDLLTLIFNLLSIHTLLEHK